MTLQKRFIAVFVSPDGKTYHRAVVYDTYNLNGAFVKVGVMISSGGMAFTLAEDLQSKISDEKNGKYTSAIYQYDTWQEIPESLGSNVPPIP
jgi:hypothetical protein